MDADVIVVGAGLAGLVATAELADAGRRVVLVDQEPEQNLGGQAFWSFGGLFLVDSPEQRRMRIKDSRALAMQDWMGTADFDRPEDHWPRRWAEAYVDFAAGEKRPWLHGQGMRFFPVVGWAERGGYGAVGHGNSVPRFHVTWGTGPGVVAPFERRVREAVARGLVTFAFRHRVDELVVTDGAATGIRGAVLEPSDVARGEASSRTEVGDFELSAQAVLVTSGGIGANHDLVRKNWPARLGTAPEHMISGVPAHVDGRMLQIAQDAGAEIINPDRMWHYVEGIKNWNPIWDKHGIRILPGPSSLWFDGAGKRLPGPLWPGFDTLGTLAHLRQTGHDHSWFVLTQKVIEKEFALSGSEQNPDLTGKDIKLTLGRIRPGAPEPVEKFKQHGEDFVVAETLEELVAGMNRLTPDAPVALEDIRREVVARDREMDNGFTKDGQVAAIHNARRYLGDKLARTATPHKFLDPANGPLIAVRLHVITRKTLGGLHTDLDGRVLTDDGVTFPGLYAAGEASGFGGGGVHGYRSLEGTFLGGCIFSGRQAGRALADATAMSSPGETVLPPEITRTALATLPKPRTRGWLHAATAPLALAAGIVLVCLAPAGSARWAAAAYTATAVLLFATSATYHLGTWPPRAARLLGRLDHANIYLFIAGSFTPLTLHVTSPPARDLFIGLIWLGAGLGALVSVGWPDAPRALSTALYLAIGWAILPVLPALFAASTAAGVLTLTGGVLYSLGAVVYATRRPDPVPAWFGFHEVFHALTIAGCTVQCVAVFLLTLS